MSKLAYKFKGSGFDAPEEKRKYKQNRELADTFKKWLEISGRDSENYWHNYKLAIKMTKNLEISVTSLHALLVAHQDHKYFEHAGIFASAVYNQVPDKEIIYDLELDLTNIGLYLSKDKTIINTGIAGGVFGHMSEGTVINKGKAGDSLGADATGLVVNMGHAGAFMGSGASAPIINYGAVSEMRDNNLPDQRGTGPVINYGHAEILGIDFNTLILNFGTALKMAQDCDDKCVAINYGKAGSDFGSYSNGIMLAVKDPESFGAKVNARLSWCAEDIKLTRPLNKYLKALKEKFEPGRKDYHAVLEALKEYPLEKITKDIEKIVREAGYEI